MDREGEISSRQHPPLIMLPPPVTSNQTMMVSSSVPSNDEAREEFAPQTKKVPSKDTMMGSPNNHGDPPSAQSHCGENEFIKDHAPCNKSCFDPISRGSSLSAQEEQEEEELNQPSGPTFPHHLMALLDRGAGRTAMWWMPDGRSFCLHPKNCGSVFMESHFSGNKFESLTRKLNRWGFKRLVHSEAPPDAFVFRHPLFQRGKPELLRGMSGGTSKLSAARRMFEDAKYVTTTKAALLERSISPQPAATTLGVANLPFLSSMQEAHRHQQPHDAQTAGGLLTNVMLSNQVLDTLQRLAQLSNALGPDLRQLERPPHLDQRVHARLPSQVLDPVTAADILRRTREISDVSTTTTTSSWQHRGFPAGLLRQPGDLQHLAGGGLHHHQHHHHRQHDVVLREAALHRPTTAAACSPHDSLRLREALQALSSSLRGGDLLGSAAARILPGFSGEMLPASSSSAASSSSLRRPVLTVELLSAGQAAVLDQQHQERKAAAVDWNRLLAAVEIRKGQSSSSRHQHPWYPTC